jgi:hypothetical protein
MEFVKAESEDGLLWIPDRKRVTIKRVTIEDVNSQVYAGGSLE